MIKFDTALCKADISIGGLKPRASFWLRIQQWKKLFLENSQMVFADKQGASAKDVGQESKLYEQIGKLHLSLPNQLKT